MDTNEVIVLCVSVEGNSALSSYHLPMILSFVLVIQLLIQIIKNAESYSFLM